MKQQTKLILKGIAVDGVPFTKEIHSLDEVKSSGNYVVVCKNATVDNGLPQISGKKQSCFCCEAQLTVTCCYSEDEAQSNAAYGQALTICDRETGSTSCYTRTIAPGKNNGNWSLWQMVATGDIESVTQNNTLYETIDSLSERIANECERAASRENMLETIFDEEISAVNKKMADNVEALVNGDIIAGVAREIYSRQGKTDNATFIERSTAGGTSVSDGVATLKLLGGNLVKNCVEPISVTCDASNMTVVSAGDSLFAATPSNAGIDAGNTMLMIPCDTLIDSNRYYLSFFYCSTTAKDRIAVCFGAEYASHRILDSGPVEANVWSMFSGIMQFTIGDVATVPCITFYPFDTESTLSGNEKLIFSNMLLVNLTEMYGAGTEPTKAECDKMFSTTKSLPKGLTSAKPSGFVSVGYNQWNPANVIIGKSIAGNAVADSTGTSIAVVNCIPCRTGIGENNGYVAGYGDGENWSDSGIEVYFTPLDPLASTGELYLQKLEKDAAYGTYVPRISGYLLIVTPVTEKLCVHLKWSGDRLSTDYEQYAESRITIPSIPEMSTWGLTGIACGGKMVQDTIDMENNKYIRRIGCVDMGDFTNWSSFVTETDNGISYSLYSSGFLNGSASPSVYGKRGNALCDGLVNVEALGVKSFMPDKSFRLYTNGTFFLRYDECSNVAELCQALKGKKLYYELSVPVEHEIVAKSAPNYLSSDYGTELFCETRVPLVASILFYMRSLVCETRNFIDRLMAGFGTTDSISAADKIIALVKP